MMNRLSDGTEGHDLVLFYVSHRTDRFPEKSLQGMVQFIVPGSKYSDDAEPFLPAVRTRLSELGLDPETKVMGFVEIGNIGLERRQRLLRTLAELMSGSDPAITLLGEFDHPLAIPSF